MNPIPAPEFAIMQERRIKALEQYAYRCRNTFKWIGQSTTNHDIRTRAYSTLETEPAMDALEIENEANRLKKIVANLCPHSVLACAADCKCERERPENWRQRYWGAAQTCGELRERLYEAEKRLIERIAEGSSSQNQGKS